MVKKDVDPKLEPILDKIEEFDPERADRLRDNYGEEPDACPVHDPAPMPHGILSGVVTESTTGPDGLVVRKHTVPVKRVPKAQKPAAPKRSNYYNYRFCNHCGNKGAYTQVSSGKEFCKYCRPKKSLKNIPAGLLEPTAEPKKKSWLARLLRL
tara:strand:+ start:228 stop:686 length:459 start_codon:yes stop_codon:yes gene_type:complete